MRIIRRSNVNAMFSIRVDPTRHVEATRVIRLTATEEREAGLMAREDGWKSRRRGRVEIGMVAPAFPGQTRAVPGSRFVTAGVS